MIIDKIDLLCFIIIFCGMFSRLRVIKQSGNKDYKTYSALAITSSIGFIIGLMIPQSLLTKFILIVTSTILIIVFAKIFYITMRN